MLKGKSSVKNWQIFLFVNGKPVQQLFTHQNFIVQSISKSYKIVVLTTGSTKIDKQHCHLSSMQCMCDVKELSMKFGKRSVGRGQNGAVEKSMACSLMSAYIAWLLSYSKMPALFSNFRATLHNNFRIWKHIITCS